jgi:hypothetical protein
MCGGRQRLMGLRRISALRFFAAGSNQVQRGTHFEKLI